MAKDILGCEVPRIYTPPLRELTEDTSVGFEVIRFADEILHFKLHPWQKWLLIHALEVVDDPEDGWRFRFRNVQVLIARQNGKALSLDTEIPTPTGWRQMGDIHIGDVVFGQDGKPSKVIGESEIFNKPMYLVTFEGGAEIKASADHLWAVQTKSMRRRDAGKGKPLLTYHGHMISENRTANLTTEELARDFHRINSKGRNDYKYRVPLCAPVEYPERPLPIDPYVLGVWLGDGHADGARVSVSDCDKNELINLLGDCVRTIKRNRTCNEISIGSTYYKWNSETGNPVRHNTIKDALISLNLINNKHIPDMYLLSSVGQRLELLRGLMDTDGSCSNDGQCTFSQKETRFKAEMVELLSSLGIRSHFREKIIKCGTSTCRAYELQFYAPKSMPVFKLRRKAERQKGTLTAHMRWKSIIDIKRIPSEPSKCIAIDNDSHLYLAGRQYTATHNTTLSCVLALYFLYVMGVKLILGTAQDVSNAEDVWMHVVEMAQDNEALAKEIEHVWYTNGAKRLQLKGNRDYRVRASNRKAGRGKSADLVLLDELREHQTWDAWAALSKTGMARKNALLWCMSNAGDGTSVVLRHFRMRAHAQLGDPDGIVKALGDSETPNEDTSEGSALGLFEWSAPPDADPGDVDAWAQANPSLGYTVDINSLRSAYADDPADVFRTECLCQWVTTTVVSAFPEGAWDAGKDERSRIADESPLFWGVDISADRAHASIAVCGRRRDGNLHVELAEYRSGTGWLVGWFQKAAPNYQGGMRVAMQTKGAPISSLMDVIGAVDGVEIVDCSGRDVAGWCGRLWDAVASCLPDSETDATPVYHISQPALDLAANIAATRPMGDGAWAWDRNKSMEDISPLVAVTMALGSATRVEAVKQKIYESAYTERGVLVV